MIICNFKTTSKVEGWDAHGGAVYSLPGCSLKTEPSVCDEGNCILIEIWRLLKQINGMEGGDA